MSADIWQVIAELALELHPDSVHKIAGRVSDIASVGEFDKAVFAFGLDSNRQLMERLVRAWKDTPTITSQEIAAALLGASKTAQEIRKHESVEMVWTGPSTGLVASRHTEQVLLELIGSARKRLFLVSFVAYDIESVTQALRDAANRDVGIDILLEASKTHGGKLDIDSIKKFKETLPVANIYTWNSESKSSGHWIGVVHAKCAVADGANAFITSANLTRMAMERNMEMGVLVRGGNLPSKLERHLRMLFETGVIERI